MKPITLTPMQRFWRLLKPDAVEIRNIYLYAIFNGLVYLSLPLGIQAIINLIQGGKVSASWILLVVIVIAGVAVNGILQIFQLRITENLQQKIFARAAFEFAYRIPRIKMEALYRKYAPELMNRFFDTLTVQKGLSKILIDFSRATLQVIFGLLLLSFYHPFFIAFSLVLVILVYAIFRFTAASGLKTSLKESKHKYEVVHWLEEIARTNITFRLAGNSELPLQRTDGLVSDYLKERESHFKVLVQQYSMMVVFKVLVATGLLAIGGVLVMEQQMNIGQFVAAEIIILLIMNSVEKLIVSMETIYDVLTALEKIGQITDMTLENSDGLVPWGETEAQNLSVIAENVYFSYPGHSKPVLRGLNLHISAGEHLALIGADDREKEGLLSVITGMYSVQQGSVAINGLPLGNLNMEKLRAAIGSQWADEHLFFGTLMDNITLGRPEATFDRVQWAVQQLGLEPFVRQLPQGYDTDLHQDDKMLSLDIRQLILLARSVVTHPGLLLLWEPLSHLSENSKERVLDFLTDRGQPWTLLAVSDDRILAKHCDRVALLQDGNIIKEGNYDSMKAHLNRDRHA